MSAKPRVTFALFAYNQERFVREAVLGALAQTYEPLELILSDDCSTDRTFALIEELASSYHGPHVVRTRRSETNLGVGQHVNRVLAEAQGELIVLAAGDDISRPHRTERLVWLWETQGRPRGSLYSGVTFIDASGRRLTDREAPQDFPRTFRFPRTLQEVLSRRAPAVPGCAHALHRDVFQAFGPLGADVVAEDLALSFRALALDGAHGLDEPLVLYRIHGANVSGVGRSEAEMDNPRAHRMWAVAFDQFARDLCAPPMKARVAPAERAKMLRHCRRETKIFRVKAATASGSWAASTRALVDCLARPPRLPLLAGHRLLLLLLGERYRALTRGLRRRLRRA